MSNGLVQVRATWIEGASPPEARRADEEPFTAGAVQSFHPDEDLPPPDDETAEAVQMARDEYLMSIVRPDGVEVGYGVPLLLAHAGPKLVEDLEVSVRGREFAALGWVRPDLAEELRDMHRCSPGLFTVKARIVDHGYGLRFLDAIESRLQEVSATNDPLREGTTFAVAPFAGEQFWQRPTWQTAERFTRTDEGVFRLAFDGRWRRSDDSFVLRAKRRCRRAHSERCRPRAGWRLRAHRAISLCLILRRRPRSPTEPGSRAPPRKRGRGEEYLWERLGFMGARSIEAPGRR